MYQNKKVIDIHGHMSTPPHFRAFAYNMIALRGMGGGKLVIPDDAMAGASERHLRMLDERNIDVQMISARPVAMMHWERPFLVDEWTVTTNDCIAQICRLSPDRFVGIAQLPQHQSLSTENCVAELDRCINELGFVGATVNPDPGADRQTPGMDQDYWFPLYKRAQELKAPLIVHPSITHDPRLDRIPHSYQYNNITEETLAVLLLEHSTVFERFPDLKIVVCHCGGALRRMLVKGTRPGVKPDGTLTKLEVRESGEMAGGSVGLGVARDQEEEAEQDLSNNLFFDTCAYDPDFLAAAIKQRGPERMLFGTEVPGSGSSLINPETGKPQDDMVPVIDGMPFLSADDKLSILRDNARRIFPLLRVY
jgi:predicted TIM-barrel fold metal-dependent hydrolase